MEWNNSFEYISYTVKQVKSLLTNIMNDDELNTESIMI